MTQAPSSPPGHDITADRQFVPWLAQHQISIACTTYQTSRLMFLGVNPTNGSIAGFERIFDRAMGLYATTERLYLSSKYQIWRFDNALAPGQQHNGHDKLYVPRLGYTTGDLDIHDIAEIDRWIDDIPWQDTAPFVFVSTLTNCVATISDRNSCQPLWKPPFISRIINEDRCHLNGLAVRDGQPRYVTAISRSDIIDGWRDRRWDGGLVMDMTTNEVIATGFSMPHSPRWYRDCIWLLNSGRGELGYIDLNTGQFEAIAFCPGYLRGLAFWDNFAIVGLSRPRSGDKTFSGLPLDDLLREKDAEPRCGLMVINLETGAIEHWLRFEGVITELYDVQVIPNVQRPMALGFQTEEIAQLITLPPLAAPNPTTAPASPPAQSELSPEIRQQRRQLAEQWLSLSLEQLQDAYAGELGQVHRTLLIHEIRYEALTDQEQAFVETLTATVSTDSEALQSILAVMLYCAPYQLPDRWFEPIKIPAWLVNDYLSYMLTAPLYFRAEGEAERYAIYLQDWFTFLHRKINQNLTTDSWRSVAWFVAQHATVTPIYFNDRNLKDVFVKWAAIAEFGLEVQGFNLHQQPLPRSQNRDKIRVGILNYAFSPHSEVFATLPCFEYLDRQRFEIFLYAETVRNHPLEEYCQSRCDRWTQLPQDLNAAVQTIREHDLDILWFGTNLAVGSKPTTLLAMHRLARVQMTSIACPTTTGITHMDYYVSGALTTPEASFQDQYSEKLITLDGPAHCYRYPLRDPQESVPTETRSNWGVAENAVVFISGANFFKLIPELRITWAKILAAVPNSVLVLCPFSQWSTVYPVTALRNQMDALLADYSVDGQRLVIQDPVADRNALQSLFKLADVYLDAFPYTGATSIIDPLEVGLPVVVRAGNSLRSRQAAALLESMDLQQFVTNDEQAYINLAVQLGTHPQHRQQAQDVLRAKMASVPAFLDSQAYATKIAALLPQLLSTPDIGTDPSLHAASRKRVVAFSLWGANPKYTTGALKNADLAPQIYPGWICRFYVDQTVPAEVVQALQAREQVEVVQMEGDRGWKMAFARFLPAADPDVEVVICRDTDSRLNLREKAAVDAWLNGPQRFHLMRDHPRHNVPMLAGLWGVKGNIPDLVTLIDQHLIDYADLGLRYGIDQHFLTTKIYPRAQSSCLVHDEVFVGQPFPQARQGLEYVGQIFQEDDSTFAPVDALLEEHLASQENLPLQDLAATESSGTPASPTSVQALFDRSRQLKQQGKLTDAEACLREVIQLYPNHWGAHNNLGTLLQNQGQREEAKACYQRALQLNANFAEAHSNLASLYQLAEDFECAKTGFYKAIQLKPDYLPAHLNLANVFKEQKRLGAATEHFQKVIELDPNHAESHFSLASIYEYQGQLAKALTAYQKVESLAPGQYYVRTFINYLYLRMCDWTEYEQRVQSVIDDVEAHLETPKIIFNPFSLSAFPVSLDLHQRFARHMAEGIRKRAAKTKQTLNFAHPRTQPDKLRVGYISPDFRDHAVGRLIYQIFPTHDRNQFEIYAYSTVAVNDAFTQKVRQGCDRYVELAPLSTANAAQRIYDDGIHLLIDLAGYTIGNGSQILSLQPAPIQAQWLGYPDTMGAEFIQYAIADQWLITPDIAASYIEKIVYLPHAFVGSPLEIAQQSMTRQECGLPENGFVYCCFNSPYKITPDLFDIWMRILTKVPEAVLWLLEGADTMMSNLQTEAEQRGVAPERLVFASKIAHDEYLARYALADLYLDTFVYNAGSTAVATSWAGLPLLTFPGPTNASRMGASICAAAGLDSLICASPRDYEQRAIHFAMHPQELAGIRQALITRLQTQETSPPLFQVETFVRSLEVAFQQMWQNNIGGQPPCDFRHCQINS